MHPGPQGECPSCNQYSDNKKTGSRNEPVFFLPLPIAIFPSSYENSFKYV